MRAVSKVLIFALILVFIIVVVSVVALLAVVESHHISITNSTGSDICVYRAKFGRSTLLRNSNMEYDEKVTSFSLLSFSRSFSISYEEGECTGERTELYCKVNFEGGHYCNIGVLPNKNLICNRCY